MYKNFIIVGEETIPADSADLQSVLNIVVLIISYGLHPRALPELAK